MILKYTLSYHHIKSALLLTGKLRPYLIKSAVQASVALLIFVWYLLTVLKQPDYYVGYLIMALMLIIIPMVFILPKKIQQKVVNAAVPNTQIALHFNNDKINVDVPESGANWDITIQSVDNVLKNTDVYVIVLKDNRALVIPKSVVASEEEKQQFNAFLDKIKS